MPLSLISCIELRAREETDRHCLNQPVFLRFALDPEASVAVLEDF